jgi:hypothetical protein
MIAQTTDQPIVRERPLGVTVLAGLAGVELVLAVVHLFQAIGILPYFIGPVAIRDFSLWYSLMWLLMIWVWLWAIRALLDVDPGAWLFVLIVSGFSVIFDFFTIMGTPSATTDVAISFLVGVAILGYTVLPSTKRAFGIR